MPSNLGLNSHDVHVDVSPRTSNGITRFTPHTGTLIMPVRINVKRHFRNLRLLPVTILKFLRTRRVSRRHLKTNRVNETGNTVTRHPRLLLRLQNNTNVRTMITKIINTENGFISRCAPFNNRGTFRTRGTRRLRLLSRNTNRTHRHFNRH